MSVSRLNIFNGVKATLRDHFNVGLGDFYVSSAHRWLVYTLVFILVGLCTFVGLYVFAAIDPLRKIPLTFMGMYAWHTAINYALSVAVVDLLAAFLLRPWGGYDNRTTGRQWGVFLAANLVGYVLQRTLVYKLVALYSPHILWVYEINPSQKPGLIVMFLYILPFWLVIGALVMRIIMSKQAQVQELFRVRIDAILEDRQLMARPVQPSEPDREVPDAADGDGVIPLPASAGVPPVSLRQVGHVTAEDHYLRIYYQGGEALENILVRMSMKTLSGVLPEDRFIQIHRSHIVNLEQVSRIKREGRSVRLAMKHGEFELPVSRYRYPEILPKLEKYLHPN